MNSVDEMLSNIIKKSDSESNSMKKIQTKEELNLYKISNSKENKSYSSFDVLFKDVLLEWIHSNHGKELIQRILMDIIETNINLPSEYIQEKLNQKISNEFIEITIKKILRDSLRNSLLK